MTFETAKGDEMDGKREKIRELFIHELAEVRGGETASGGPVWDYLCGQFYSTMACGEEVGPCAPTGC